MRLAAGLEVDHQQGELVAVGGAQVDPQGTALERGDRFIGDRLEARAPALDVLGRETGPVAHGGDGDPAEHRLLDAAVVTRIEAGDVVVAEIRQVAIAEADQRLPGLHLLEGEHVRVEFADRLRERPELVLGGREVAIVPFTRERGIVDLVEVVEHVVGADADGALRAFGSRTKAVSMTGAVGVGVAGSLAEGGGGRQEAGDRQERGAGRGSGGGHTSSIAGFSRSSRRVWRNRAAIAPSITR